MTSTNNNSNNDINNESKNVIKKREFILNEDVSSKSIKDIIMGIEEINRHDNEEQNKNGDYIRKPIKLIVDTFGGSVYDGMGLVGVIDTSKTPVHTYVYSKAMSMGFAIFASGHKRFAHSLSTLMFHEIAGGTYDKLEGIKQSVEEWERLQKMYEDYILSVSNVPYHKMIENRRYKKEWYISAQEAFNYGLVDEILVSTRK